MMHINRLLLLLVLAFSQHLSASEKLEEQLLASFPILLEKARSSRLTIDPRHFSNCHVVSFYIAAVMDLFLHSACGEQCDDRKKVVAYAYLLTSTAADTDLRPEIVRKGRKIDVSIARNAARSIESAAKRFITKTMARDLGLDEDQLHTVEAFTAVTELWKSVSREGESGILVLQHTGTGREYSYGHAGVVRKYWVNETEQNPIPADDALPNGFYPVISIEDPAELFAQESYNVDGILQWSKDLQRKNRAEIGHFHYFSATSQSFTRRKIDAYTFSAAARATERVVFDAKRGVIHGPNLRKWTKPLEVFSDPSHKQILITLSLYKDGLSQKFQLAVKRRRYGFFKNSLDFLAYYQPHEVPLPQGGSQAQKAIDAFLREAMLNDPIRLTEVRRNPQPEDFDAFKKRTKASFYPSAPLKDALASVGITEEQHIDELFEDIIATYETKPNKMRFQVDYYD